MHQNTIPVRPNSRPVL